MKPISNSYICSFPGKKFSNGFHRFNGWIIQGNHLKANDKGKKYSFPFF